MTSLSLIYEGCKKKKGFTLLHVYPYRSFLHKNGRTRFGRYLATELLWAKIFSAAGFAKNVIKSKLVLQILRHCIIKKVVIDSRQNGNLYKKMILPPPTSALVFHLVFCTKKLRWIFLGWAWGNSRPLFSSSIFSKKGGQNLYLF